MFVTASAVTGTELVNRNGVSPVHSEKNIQDRAMWDVQFKFNASQQTGCYSLAGIGFDGMYFYCPDWFEPTIYRFNKNGTYLDSFIIPGVPNLIDLAYDGTYFYGQGQSMTDFIYVMNFTAHTLVTTMPSPHPAWFIAYDTEQDRFWIGTTISPLYLIDRSGMVYDTFTIPGSKLGIAWDPYTQIAGYDGPFLWISTGADPNGRATIKVIDLATKILIPGVEHNVSAELGEGYHGGLEFTINYQTGFGTLFGMVQGLEADDYAFGYEITIINELPIADFSWTPQNPSINQEISFDASASQDPDGTITLYEWDWDNDGVYDESQSSPTTTHSWTSPGSYPLTVRVTDDDTGTATVTKTVEVGITLEIDINGGIGVKAIITNNGGSDATDISWQIHVEGGMLGMINKTVNGTIDITAGGSKTVGTGMLLGFGAISIVARVADEEQTATGTQLIIFSMIK
jgi:hypothetical protein